MLVGRYPESTLGEKISGYFALMLLCVLLLPWIAIAVGCILLGVHGIARGEPSSVIGLPAGVALLLAGPLLLYLDRRWYPPICRFDFDGQVLTYAFKETQVPEFRTIQEIRKVVRRTGPKSHRTKGYQVVFNDRKWIYICRSLTHADELYDVLRTHLAAPLAEPSDARETSEQSVLKSQSTPRSP